MPHSPEDLETIPFTTERQSRRTGNWRFSRPELAEEDCIMCELCIEFCPDVSIHQAESEESVVVDYDYCKGCGICAQVCPTDAFTMEDE